MNRSLLHRHLESYRRKLADPESDAETDARERAERSLFYRSWDAIRLRAMTDQDLYEYVARLWAMRIWGNKRYVVDRLIADNGLPKLREQLADLVWGDRPTRDRWDDYLEGVKGMGPAMMSEILCHAHPDSCMLWNRRTFVGLRYLGLTGLPKYDYQLTGEKYEELSLVVREIASEMGEMGFEDTSLLAVDYFLWSELQVEEKLSRIHKKGSETEEPVVEDSQPEARFIHNDIRDKLLEIGEWLGFKARTEIKVAEGSKVDTVWESTIGNMGRVIYVFEVQTKGSIDSLILNLLKALNNPAVQGVVAVSDSKQLGTIERHATEVKPLAEKLRYWDFVEVLDTHEKLYSVNEAINRLNLVPEGF